MRFSLQKSAVAIGAAALAGASQAAVDVAPITATLTDITAVGVAVFAVFVGVKLYKWVRRAL